MARKHGGGKPIIDMQDARFGRLLVTGRAERPARYSLSPAAGAWWRCKCDCGAEGVFSGARLRYGATLRCGQC